MLDPGRYFAEAIYFLQYALAQILWAVGRATLSIAVIVESVNTWITENVGYFVELLVNALSAPLGGMFILALTALGLWYLLNNILPTNRWVDPSKLATYGLIALFFFSSPIIVIEMMEDLRGLLNAGIDQALLDGATGDIFDTGMNGTDTGLPGAIPDVNGDGVAASFDLAAAFMLVANLDELDSSEFPVDFEAAYFPFGDPSSIDLGDEADQELAKALASDGIERLFFALVAIPAAIAEHFLRLALTGAAMLLYAGVPMAMPFAFFNYTQSFLASYLRQFINLLIETLMSVIIVAVMISLLAAAALQGIGLYIGASLITLIVLFWRIQSAMKLAAAALDLFGGAIATGGSGGLGLLRAGGQAAAGAVGVAGMAGAALTGGTSLALTGASLAGGAALSLAGSATGGETDANAGRAAQLKAMSGYLIGRSQTARRAVEVGHEVRTLGRNFRDGGPQETPPDMLDYLRAGTSMASAGSSPWLAMRLSPSLRAAYDEIGGRRYGNGARDAVFDGEGEPVDLPGANDGRPTNARSHSGRPSQNAGGWRDEPATPRQLAYLNQLDVDIPEGLNRGQASDLIDQARNPYRRQPQTADNGAENGYSHLQQPGTAGNGATDSDSQQQAILNRFATLEQALTNLTTALTSPEGSGRIAGSPPGEQAVSGPIPDWLREEPAGESRQNIQTGNAGQGTAADKETGAAQGNAQEGGGQPHDLSAGSGRPEDETGTTPPANIRLEPYQDIRRQAIHETLARLGDPQSPAGQAAASNLVIYVGQERANLIGSAVSEHTAAPIQAAAEATAKLAAQYRAQGLDDAGILATFQSGEAATAIREVLDTPLSDEQLSAVADMVLMPQLRLSQAELVTVIGREVAAGATGEQAVVQALGSPVGFGGQTGNIRGVMAGARTMNLSPAELARLAGMIQEGLRDAVQAELAGRGFRPEVVQDFVSDMAALPRAIVIPQTTANLPLPLDDSTETSASSVEPLAEVKFESRSGRSPSGENAQEA